MLKRIGKPALQIAGDYSSNSARIINYREPGDPEERYFFLADNDRALIKSGMKTILRRALWDIGLDSKGGPHILRHTFATLYLRKGGNLEVLRKILRHKFTTTTMIYTHLNQDDVRIDYLRTDAMSDILRHSKKRRK